MAGSDPADLRESVITLDAMHTQDDTAKTILELGADYVFTVKGNRTALLSAVKKLPWTSVPRGSQTTERGYGRRATRTIKVIQAAALPGWPEFPGAAQIAQLRRTVTKGGGKTVEVVYLVTSTDHHTAPPAVLAGWVQGRWGIENRVHWVRDVTYDEDRSQVCMHTLPRIMATLRNTAITILRLANITAIAPATRHHARNPERAINCLLTCRPATC